VAGRRVEKDTFFFWRKGCGRCIIELGRDSGSEEVGESRMLDAAEAWEKIEDTEERIEEEMEALEAWGCEEMDRDRIVGSVAKEANSMCDSATW
jgi:hypothetical protein